MRAVADIVTQQGAPLKGRRRRRGLLIFPAFSLVFVVYGYSVFLVPSASMEPTLMPGDEIVAARSWIAYPFGRGPSRGDIILFDMPAAAAPGRGAASVTGRRRVGLFRPGGEVLIKRVVGLPGETVVLKAGRILINGEPLNASYAARSSDLTACHYGVIDPVTLGGDEYYVLGDNHSNSEDSRYWGPVKRRQIVGRFVSKLFRRAAPAQQPASAAEVPAGEEE